MYETKNLARYFYEIRVLIENFYDIQKIRVEVFNRIVNYIKHNKSTVIEKIHNAFESQMEGETHLGSASQCAIETHHEDASHRGVETHPENASQYLNETQYENASQDLIETQSNDASQKVFETHIKDASHDLHETQIENASQCPNETHKINASHIQSETQGNGASQVENETQIENASHGELETQSDYASQNSFETHVENASQEIDETQSDGASHDLVETHKTDASHNFFETHEEIASQVTNETQKKFAFSLLEEKRYAEFVKEYVITEKIEIEEIKNLIWLFKKLYEIEKNLKLILDEWSREHPLRKNYLNYVKGIGPILSSGIIAWLSEPILKANYVSKLWSYCGLAPNSKRIRGEKVNYNPKVKTFCWKITECFIKKKGFGKKLYDEFKEQAKQKHPDWSKGHIHNYAKRKVVKIFLASVWEVWRKMNGLQVTEPYSIERLGHVDKIYPDMWIEKEKKVI